MSESTPLLSAHTSATGDAIPAPAAMSTQAYALFVGEHYPAYCARWESAGRKGISWNWAAFCFGPGWMAYRKMHGFCAVFLVLVAAEAAFEQIANVPAGFTALIYLLVSAGFGISGDRLYKHHVDIKVGEITHKQDRPASIQAKLQCQGGTNLCSALYFSTILMSVLVTIVILLSAPPTLS